MGVSFNIMCPNSSIYSDEKSRVLVDKTKSGKVRPWREKKIANVDYFELLHILEFKKAERVKDCAEILEYKQNRETGERKLYRVPVKDTDFMTDDEEKNLKRLSDLEEGLHRKRLISYGGLLKEIHKKLNLDDTEEGDLIHTDDDEKADEDGFSIIAMWNWERKNYFIKE
nr:replication protein B - Bacillus sp. plasmid pTB19 (fragments) [Bacillus sp. (in: firmicutes)]